MLVVEILVARLARQNETDSPDLAAVDDERADRRSSQSVVDVRRFASRRVQLLA